MACKCLSAKQSTSSFISCSLEILQRLTKYSQVLWIILGFTVTYELSFNCGELLFEAGEILVERPHKCLVCPERWLIFRTLSGTAGRAWAWRAWFWAVSSHLIYEPLQPKDCLPVHSNVLQDRVQAILQHRQKKVDRLQSGKKATFHYRKKKVQISNLHWSDEWPQHCSLLKFSHHVAGI